MPGLTFLERNSWFVIFLTLCVIKHFESFNAFFINSCLAAVQMNLPCGLMGELFNLSPICSMQWLNEE